MQMVVHGTHAGGFHFDPRSSTQSTELSDQMMPYINAFIEIWPTIAAWYTTIVLALAAFNGQLIPSGSSGIAPGSSRLALRRRSADHCIAVRCRAASSQAGVLL